MHIAMGGHGQAWPPRGYAGVERVGSWWVTRLRELGHEVTLVANGGSTLPVDHLIPGHEGNYHQTFQMARDGGAEVVHDNNDAQEPNPGRWAGGPYVFTVHACVWRGNPNPVFLSNNQARWHGYEGTPTVVHNGLPLGEYPFCAEKDDYLFWCASIRDCKARKNVTTSATGHDEYALSRGFHARAPDVFKRDRLAAWVRPSRSSS